jgi:hypothetical protein
MHLRLWRLWARALGSAVSEALALRP